MTLAEKNVHAAVTLRNGFNTHQARQFANGLIALIQQGVGLAMAAVLDDGFIEFRDIFRPTVNVGRDSAQFRSHDFFNGDQAAGGIVNAEPWAYRFPEY